MTLNELVKWRQDHPNAPLYQVARIHDGLHLVAHASSRTFTTVCGLKGDSNIHVLVYQIPGHFLNCKACTSNPEFILSEKRANDN
jgi:hypothetical protein